MAQTNTAIMLVGVLIAIVIIVVVLAVVMSKPATPSYPGTTYPGTQPGTYPGTQPGVSTSWCVAGQTASLADYGTQGYATFNGMATFQGQSLCKATLVTNGVTYYFYTNEPRTVWYTTDASGRVVSSYLGTAPQQPSTPQSEIIKTALNSLSLTSGQEGTVTTPGGASVFIPAGAVPTTDAGTAGTMIFNVNERSDVTPTFPEGFLPGGSVYELGPEGFNFELPVQVTLPIGQGVDPATVGGLAYYDESTGQWVRVPGTVDPETGTVSVYTTHFSLWAPWSSRSWRDEMNSKGGWLKVINGHIYETGPWGRIEERCKGLPVTITYGICIMSWVPKNAADATWWNAVDALLMAHDQGAFSSQRESESWVPAGTFNLVEILSVSEVNHDPLYLPCYAKYWRNIGDHTVDIGQTKEFSGGSGVDSSWTLATTTAPPPCWGVRTTAVGTGDVQITLTWHSSVDLDLHVIDPRSEEIYYLNTESSSGGTLDRDNKCSNFEMGRPENVYWPTGGAPSGQYKVQVRYFTSCDDSGPVSYTVRVVTKGEVKTYSGTLESSGQTDDVVTFTV